MAATLKFTQLTTDDQAEGYAQLLSHCYARPIAESRKWLTRYQREDIAVLIDPRDPSPDGVAAGLLLIRMGHAYGGRLVPGIGIAGVGVAPGHRGRGTASLLMDRAVRHIHGLGAPLSGLYPATQALYRRSGYEQAGHRCQLRMPLNRIVSTERSLTVRAAVAEDRAEIHRIYERWAAANDGALERPELLWRRVEMIPPAREEPTRCFVVEGERAKRGSRAPLEAYVYMYMPAGPDGKPEVHVNDMAAVSGRAGRRLWSFLASHSTICSDLVWHCTPAHPLLTLLPEQSFKVSLHMYWMLRVVDAAQALEARGYPAGLRTELAIDVQDPLLKSNSGRLLVRVEESRARVTKDPRKRFSGPRIALTIDTLATLYSGFMPAAQLRFLNRVAGTDEAVAIAAAMFGGQTPAMCEMF